MEKCTFNKTDLSWIVDYDYVRSGCTCDDWPCRCTTIEETWINNVNVNQVIEELYNRHSRDVSYIDKYCFDRICYAFKIYDKYLYEVETCYGYYGEEVRGVWFEDEEKICNAYYEMLALDTDLEKIQYCLRLEYNYLIKLVEHATSASVVEVFTSDIFPAQNEYFVKLSKNVIEKYKDRNLPIAVCVRDGNKYRLIDGYHRFVANQDKEKVDIIILE
jgi:hypothetical protein